VSRAEQTGSLSIILTVHSSLEQIVYDFLSAIYGVFKAIHC